MKEQNYLGCEWNNKRLGDILEIMTGGTPSKNNDEYWSDGNIPWMVSGDVNKGIINEVDGKITELGMNNSAAKLLPKDTVMIALNGQGKTKGKVAYLNIEVTCNQSLAGFLPNKAFNSKYLHYNLQNRYTEIRNLTGDGARNGLNLSILKDINVLFPPLKEQQKIVEILSTVDLQIDDTDKLIEKTKELKKGLMQRLLTKGIGHSEFKKSEVWEIPVEWEVKELNNISTIVDSLHETPNYVDSGYSMIRVVDVNGKAINTDSAFKVTEETYLKFIRKYEPQSGDIIMSRVGSYGLVSYLKDNEKVCLGQNIVVITTKLMDKSFLFYCLSSEYIKNEINELTVGSSQKTLSLANINKLHVALPTIIEQKQIANILLSVDDQIEEYENKKIKLEQLKQGLMQQLLTGKIRVK